MAEQLKLELDAAAAAAAVEAAASETLSQEIDMPGVIARTLKHTEHLQETVDTVGSDVDSMRCLVLPMLEENAVKLEKLFAAVDNLDERVLPEVVASLSRMEESVRALEERHAELQPSSLQRMGNLLTSYSSFFGSASSKTSKTPALRAEDASQGWAGAATVGALDTSILNKAFVPPQVGVTNEELAR